MSAARDVIASETKQTEAILGFVNQQSTINNQQSTINNQQSTINNQQSTIKD